MLAGWLAVLAVLAGCAGWLCCVLAVLCFVLAVLCCVLAVLCAVWLCLLAVLVGCLCWAVWLCWLAGCAGDALRCAVLALRFVGCALLWSAGCAVLCWLW
jgi:hypothetical protein